MRAKRLQSSLIERAAYDPAARGLQLWFRGTGLYLYLDVPEATFEGLCAADSAGRYSNRWIKGRYRCRPDPARRRFRPAA